MNATTPEGLRRRQVLSLAAAVWLGGASTGAPAQLPAAGMSAVLAPTGRLRIGVYAGSPTSLVLGSGGRELGVSVEIGRALAQRLGVPADLVEFERVAAVIEAMKAGAVDMTVTNATPARAAQVDFTPALLELELGWLVLPGSPVRSADEVDRPGVRVGVSQGSSSQATLSRQLQSATVVPAASLRLAAEMLAARRIDAFATNKAILFQLADGLPGARVLDGRWGLEHLAIAVPKGRDAGLVTLRAFAEEARASGLVQAAAARAGLRGSVAVGP